MRNDDRAAFEEFVQATYADVVRIVTLATGNREGALDAAQEAFARLYPRWRRIRDYDRPDLWVRSVALRIARRATGRHAGGHAIDAETAAPETGRADPAVRQAITALPSGQRTAIVLFYFEDLPVAEIARVMDCAPATVKVHLHRARTTLARVLKEEVDHVS